MAPDYGMTGYSNCWLLCSGSSCKWISGKRSPTQLAQDHGYSYMPECCCIWKRKKIQLLPSSVCRQSVSTFPLISFYKFRGQYQVFDSDHLLELHHPRVKDHKQKSGS